MKRTTGRAAAAPIRSISNLCFALALLCAGVVVSATARSGANRANVTKGCVGKFDAAVDYFPDKVTVDDASNFSVDYRRSYKVVTVKEAHSGGRPERYVLVQCGTPIPRLDGALSDAQVVTVPITSLFSASPTHLPFLVDLHRLDVLTGVSRLKGLIGDEILARVATGKIREFAPVSEVDAERVVASHPSLFMIGGVPAASLSAIRAAGVPVVANIEWLESTALARAEWVKYMALFLNEEKSAESIYGETKARYRSLSASATFAPQTTWPLVMTGRSTRGMFTIAGGRSYVAALIRDAGGRYAWSDNKDSGTRAIDLEAQIRRAANADFWINGGGWKSLPAMLDDEPRYAEFKAYRSRQVWVYERRLTPDGSNDYWSRSVSRPDVVLADLIKIFHPALVSQHSFEWYMPVPVR